MKSLIGENIKIKKINIFDYFIYCFNILEATKSIIYREIN